MSEKNVGTKVEEMLVKEKANLFLTSSFFKTVVIRYRVPLHACDRSICADWKISSKLLFHFISISIQFKAIFKSSRFTLGRFSSR